MKILVLNGSPKKKELSVSMRYMEFIEKNLLDVDFINVDIGSRINKIEKDDTLFVEIMEQVSATDAVIWAFPLYYLYVSSQLKRFIELINEQGEESRFVGKYATSVSTSIHFFDNIAHKYMHSISEDLGMNYIVGHSASMSDLMEKDKRKNILTFAQNFISIIKDSRPTVRVFPKLNLSLPVYTPKAVKNIPKTKNKRIILFTDSQEQDRNLNNMIDAFVKSCPSFVEVINLHKIDLKGGCLGCLKCGYENKCSYTDDFSDIMDNKIMTADAIVYAFKIVDRAVSSRVKMFQDRHFVKNHQPILKGKQIVYLISGPLGQIENLRDNFASLSEVSKSNLLAVVSDENEDNEKTTALLKYLASDLINAIEKNRHALHTFLGEGGTKLFRDFVYLSPIFRMDHKYYKKHKMYDFPYKDRKLKIASRVVRFMIKISPIRKQIYADMKQFMMKPYRKVLDKK